MKPFMSAVPRPYTRSSRHVAVNGGVVHGWPSTGTTSVCPDSTMPPRATLPSCPGNEASRLALRPSSSKLSDAVTSRSRR